MALGERASALYGNPERLEVAGRDEPELRHWHVLALDDTAFDRERDPRQGANQGRQIDRALRRDTWQRRHAVAQCSLKGHDSVGVGKPLRWQSNTGGEQLV